MDLDDVLARRRRLRRHSPRSSSISVPLEKPPMRPFYQRRLGCRVRAKVRRERKRCVIIRSCTFQTGWQPTGRC